MNGLRSKRTPAATSQVDAAVESTTSTTSAKGDNVEVSSLYCVGLLYTADLYAYSSVFEAELSILESPLPDLKTPYFSTNLQFFDLI